jgi:hypothetical protein
MDMTKVFKTICIMEKGVLYSSQKGDQVPSCQSFIKLHGSEAYHKKGET